MFRFFRRNREAVKKYLLIFFLSIVSIGMVITLAPIPTGDTSRMQMDVLAEMGGYSITTQDLQRTIQSRLRNSSLGYDSRLVPTLAPGVLDDMILRRALEAQARKLGIAVSKEELRAALQAIPWLYAGGNFIGMDRYQDMIQQQTGLTVAQFEAQLRESIMLDKIRAVVTDGVQVTSDEVREEFRQRNAKTKVEYVSFDPSQYLKAVEVTAPAVAAYFQKNPDRYKLPEQRQVRYVLIDQDKVRAQVKVTDDELRRYYAQHLADYRVQDRVKVAQILLKTAGKSPQEVSTIEKTAQEVLDKIRAGAQFGDLAKKYSEDSSASNGGDVGWIGHGQTVKEFEDAAFSMKPGQVSGLIKTDYGIHIIMVLDKQTAHQQSFEEVKDSIRSELEKQKLADAQQSLANQLAGQLRAKPQEFQTGARQAGLEAKETPLFKYNQTIPDFGSSETFFNLAFQLRQGEIGMPITVPKGLAIIQVTQIVLAHQPKLEEVRALVEQDYRADQSKVLALEKAKEFAAKCKNGDFRKIAQAMGLKMKESKDFAPQDYVEGLGLGSQLSAAFTLAPGQTSDVIPLSGNDVVLHVVSHTPANDADFAQQQDQITEQLLERERAVAFELFRQNLKRELQRSGELKLNEAALKQFVASYEKP